MHRGGVAAAKQAELRAEWYMQIQRQGHVGRSRSQSFRIHVGADSGGDVRCGGIAGVARHNLVVCRDQVGDIHGTQGASIVHHRFDLGQSQSTQSSDCDRRRAKARHGE